MPRGTKLCPNPACLKPSGPRAFRCKHCSTNFVIKGEIITREPITAGYKRVDEEKNEILFEMSDFFKPVENYQNDEVNLRCYDGNAQCFESEDKEYRLRYAATFMGVSQPDGRPYILLKRTRQNNAVAWTLVSRFKREQSALKAFDRIVKGLPPVKTRKELKAERRIEKFIKKAGKL